MLTNSFRFVHGGHNSQQNTTYDELYILTLPGFAWFKADYDIKSPRAHHTCSVVGSGKRQMVSVGGVNLQHVQPRRWSEDDTFTRGLGVFDLTDLFWTDSYDASAAAYDSPSVVKDWYGNG